MKKPAPKMETVSPNAALESRKHTQLNQILSGMEKIRSFPASLPGDIWDHVFKTYARYEQWSVFIALSQASQWFKAEPHIPTLMRIMDNLLNQFGVLKVPLKRGEYLAENSLPANWESPSILDIPTILDCRENELHSVVLYPSENWLYLPGGYAWVAIRKYRSRKSTHLMVGWDTGKIYQTLCLDLHVAELEEKVIAQWGVITENNLIRQGYTLYEG